MLVNILGRRQFELGSRHRAGDFRSSAGTVGLRLAVTSVLFCIGCAAPERPILTDAEFQERAKADAAQTAETFGNAIGKLLERLGRRSADDSDDATMHVLAISGGGDYGAFGAGFLVGWGSATDPQGRRPDFDVVTGVSTGALLAPFAFLGTDDTCRQVEDFYRNPKPDWIRERGLLFFLPSNPSFMTIPGLKRDIRAAVDHAFATRLAEESRKGRILVVSATDLDFGRQKFWNLAAECESIATDAELDRVQRMLLASSAIPAVFPPVAIGDALYADGGVTANVFLRLDPHNPAGLISRWKAAYPDRPLPKVRFWIIINNQLAHIPKTVQPRWPEIVSPSLETPVRSATLAEVRWLAAETDYVNAVYGTDIEVRVAAIPDDWRPPVEGSFKKETMVSLSDLGRKMGADSTSWKVWAKPRSIAPGK